MSRSRLRFLPLLLLPLVLAPSAAWSHHGEQPPPAPPPNVPRYSDRPRVGTPTVGEKNGATTGPTVEYPYQSWIPWWLRNRDRLLGLPAARREALNAALARRKARGPDDPNREKARAVVAATLRLGAMESDLNISTSAIIALGKARDPLAAPRLQRLLKDRASNPAVRESAMLALGMIGGEDPEVLKLLKAVLTDRKRKMRDRAHAALAMGYLGNIGALHPLIAHGREKGRAPDVGVCSLLGLGFLGEEMVVRDLAAAAESTVSQFPTAHRVAALAAMEKLGSREAIPHLLRALASGETELRRQAALSLGPLARPDDKEVVKALIVVLAKDRDSLSRALAAVSLGEIGPPSAARPLAEAFGTWDPVLTPFAAVALGLLTRSCQDPTIHDRVCDRMRRVLVEGRGVHVKAAAATALGIARDPSALPALTGLLADYHPSIVRRRAAEALGLIGDGGARKDLRKLLTTVGDFRLVGEAARSLAMLGDLDSAGILESAIAPWMRRKKSEHARGSAALALGYLTLPETSAPLRQLLRDSTEPANLRTLAALALGVVMDEGEVPLLSRVGDHLNPHLSLEVLNDVIAIY